MATLKSRPGASKLGLAADVPSDSYEQRRAKVRNRVKLKPLKVESPKPPPHRVGRSKRGG
jgi:hypothetical protein